MKKFALLCAVLLGAAGSVVAAPLFNAGDPFFGGQLDTGTGQFNVGVAGTAATVNNWPAAESPDHAIDGFGQKYLNFAEMNTGFIVTPAVGQSIATSIQIWTANDAEERDPASFTLYGTNQAIAGAGPFPLSSFTQITTGPLALPTLRQPGGTTTALVDTNSQTVSFANSTAYRSYMVIFPDVKNSGAANSMQTGEVELIGTVVPEPGTLGLLGLTTAGIVGLRRRR